MTGPDAGLPGEQRNDEQARPISRRTDGTGHWLIFNDDREVTGCFCGFLADVGDDAGYGDSVIDHIADVAASEVRVELQAARDEAARITRHRDWWQDVAEDNTKLLDEARDALAAARRTLDEQRSAIERYRDRVFVFCPGRRGGEVCALPDEHNGLCWFDAGSSPDTETRDEETRHG